MKNNITNISFIVIFVTSLALSAQAYCGDGIIDPGEECDDGNYYLHDSCAECKDATCGDGILHLFEEECDDGNTISGDGCDESCNIEEECDADIMLVIDRSGSMRVEVNGHTRFDILKEAAVSFLENSDNPLNRFGMASFANVSTLDQPITTDTNQVIDSINDLEILGGLQATNMEQGLKTGQEELESQTGDRIPIMILLSDGAPNLMNDPPEGCEVTPESPNNCTEKAIQRAEDAKAAGTTIFVIGIDTYNFSEEVLKNISSGDGYYFRAVNASKVESILNNLTICPCGSYDCTQQGHQCNQGFCNETADRCELSPFEAGTDCERDGDLCTLEMCDAFGACVDNSTKDCSGKDGQCQEGVCNSSTGECEVSYDGFLNQVCDNDDDPCTLDYCDDQGNCVYNNTLDCSDFDGMCQEGVCDPVSGECVVSYDDFVDEPCENDSDLCTLEYCNDQGNCIYEDDVDCSGKDGQCQEGVCNSSTGTCYADYTGFEGLSCDNDDNLCTLDYCDDQGQCLFEEDKDCSGLDGVCKEGMCNESTGDCYESYENYPLSTYCEVDDNPCTVQHCDGDGYCVLNPNASIPPECKVNITQDAKVASAMPTSNFGKGRYLMINPKTYAIDWSYIRANVTNLMGMTISKSNLYVTVYYTGHDIPNIGVDAYFCPDHDFDEETITWRNRPLDDGCHLADTFNPSHRVIALYPVTVYEWDLLDETQEELSSGDGYFTVILKGSTEGEWVEDHSRFVQFCSKEYPRKEYRPVLRIQ